MLHTIQLMKESRAYSWPKKDIIFKEAMVFQSFYWLRCDENTQQKDNMRFLGVGARRLLKLSDADQPVH